MVMVFVVDGFCDFMWFFVFSFLLAFLGLCCVRVSAVLVFAEGASAASAAYLEASISTLNNANKRNYYGSPRRFTILVFPVKAWNRTGTSKRSLSDLTMRFSTF
jgi:hypothetical protein